MYIEQDGEIGKVQNNENLKPFSMWTSVGRDNYRVQNNENLKPFSIFSFRVWR